MATITPVRTITYTVELDSIQPSTPQFAGARGDHNATRVIFVLPEELVKSAYIYRVEYVDDLQFHDTTGLLTVSDDQVYVDLIQAWTIHGGVGHLRLVVSELTEQGEEQTIHSVTASIYFDERDLRTETAAATHLS